MLWDVIAHKLISGFKVDMRKAPTIFGIAIVGVLAVWFVGSENSPLNYCVPADTIRILMDGREYHIPVEWQPSIASENGESFPTRFVYEDHTGTYTGRGTTRYCQAKDEEPDEYQRITFNPQIIERVSPGFWERHSQYKYLSKLSYIGVDDLGKNAPPISEPKYEFIGTAYDGMYKLYENAPKPPDKTLYLYSLNWVHEGAHVKADKAIIGQETIGYRIWAALFKGSNMRMTISNSYPAAPEAEQSNIKIPPQRWPSMLEEVTNLMRSFEVERIEYATRALTDERD